MRDKVEVVNEATEGPVQPVCVSTVAGEKAAYQRDRIQVAMTDEHPVWCRQPDAPPSSSSADNTLHKYFHGVVPTTQPRHRKFESKTSQRSEESAKNLVPRHLTRPTLEQQPSGALMVF